ncbi:2-oxo acid dehydrogenase subunit E2 [Pirellulaceae bacterium]|jgi:pyruvate dehydrogenase E2 component (dihydrolipoamide acetyltransferase)|nr:2-oxo acid dehydrogenase subunit E2 [Pirellulaceae bacterium]
MPTIAVRIPQMGEGLQEALLVEFLKQPGEQITRDEPIYVMETDKATTDVESPYDGVLVEWTAEPGTVMAIGSEVGRMEVADGVKEMPAGHGPADEATADDAKRSESDSANEKSGGSLSSPKSKRSDVVIPPRTKKYLKEKGLLDVADSIPVAGSKMMPDDVDRFLSAQTKTNATYTPEETDEYAEAELPKSQVTLNYRLVRGSTSCVPVTVMQTVDWEAIFAAREKLKSESTGDTKPPSGFAMMMHCVVQTMMDHPKFRSSLVGDGKYLRTFKNVSLGIAVGLPGDELLTAVVKNANQLSREQFFAAANEQIELARSGTDQADSSVTISVSNIGSAGMRWGIPAIVSPAAATLALGEVYEQPIPDGDSFKFRKTAELTLSFDHRLINGIGAADFMNQLKEKIESYV